MPKKLAINSKSTSIWRKIKLAHMSLSIGLHASKSWNDDANSYH